MRGKWNFYFTAAILLTLPLVYFLIDRAVFSMRARETVGIVQRIHAENDNCGRRRRRHNCTNFEADLRYDVDEISYQVTVSAGSARGHNKPTSLADYAVGQSEKVAYDESRPSRAYRDTVWDIWGAPIITFFLQVAAFIASLKEERRDWSDLSK